MFRKVTRTTAVLVCALAGFSQAGVQVGAANNLFASESYFGSIPAEDHAGTALTIQFGGSVATQDLLLNDVWSSPLPLTLDNSHAHWASLAAALTDGVNDPLTLVLALHPGAPAERLFSWTSTEAEFFGPPEPTNDFEAYQGQLEWIHIQVGAIDEIPTSDANMFELQLTTDAEVYTVPSPATLIQLALALALFVVLRHRRRRLA